MDRSEEGLAVDNKREVLMHELEMKAALCILKLPVLMVMLGRQGFCVITGLSSHAWFDGRYAKKGL